jgi:hypothetical protein
MGGFFSRKGAKEDAKHAKKSILLFIKLYSLRLCDNTQRLCKSVPSLRLCVKFFSTQRRKGRRKARKEERSMRARFVSFGFSISNKELVIIRQSVFFAPLRQCSSPL